MQSSHTDQPLSKKTDRGAFPQDWLLSFATAPLLIAVLGAKALHDTILNFSTSSEEILRGDRLPLLHFPPSEE